MTYLTAVLFLFVGIINFMPLFGVISSSALTQLYQVSDLSDDIAILLRHRAVLFGITGALIMYAAFKPELRLLATTIGLVSMVTFMGLAFQSDTSNPNIIQVARIDTVAVVILIIGFSLHAIQFREN